MYVNRYEVRLKLGFVFVFTFAYVIWTVLTVHKLGSIWIVSRVHFRSNDSSKYFIKYCTKIKGVKYIEYRCCHVLQWTLRNEKRRGTF